MFIKKAIPGAGVGVGMGPGLITSGLGNIHLIFFIRDAADKLD